MNLPTWIKRDVWYKYLTYLECSSQDLKKRGLPKQNGWTCWEIRPFIKINGERHRAEFKLSDKRCLILFNDKKLSFPLEECTFSFETKYFHHKRLNWNKQKPTDHGNPSQPSRYGEYYVTVKVLDKKKD